MRKYQVEKKFQNFCGDWLLVNNRPQIYGGKAAKVDFQILGIRLTFSPEKNAVYKAQARDTLWFFDAKDVLSFVKKLDAMKRSDPLYRGIYG